MTIPSNRACEMKPAKTLQRRFVFAPALSLLLIASGCQSSSLQSLAFWNKKEPPINYTTPEDSLVLRGGELMPDQGLQALGGDFEGARRLFQDKKYAEAEPIFEKIADNKKNTMQVLEAARYYQAECLYKRGKYPAAGDRFVQLLNNFPTAAHGEESRKRLFDIANYWLDETRDEMEMAREVREGKRSFVMPTIVQVSFETSKPLLDMEGRAIRLLESVHMTDPRGPLGEKALFYIGSVKFYREEYRDAEHYFTQLFQNYPNGVHAPNALKLSITCHMISQGGPNYDVRRLQEAREMIEMAKRSYPELQQQQGPWLTQHAVQIHNLQAEHDFDMARFYERTGHPGSAHFYYEIVRLRYPGTPQAEKASEKLSVLRSKAQREAGSNPSPADNTQVVRPFVPSQPMTNPQGEFGPRRDRCRRALAVVESLA